MNPESKNHQRQLQEARSAAAFLDRVFNEITDSILIINPQSYKILTFNQSALNNLELDEAQLLGTTCHQLFYQRSIPCETSYKTCPIKEILNNPQYIMTEYEYTNKNNKIKYFEASVNPIKDKHGAIEQIVLILRDITQKKKSEHRARGLMEVDEITGLYNQTHLYKQLKREFSRSQRHKRPFSMVLVSIDNQNLYRKLGLLNQHEFLAKTGRIINNTARDVDTVYRYGERDFAVLLPETTGKQAIIFAQRLKTHYQNSLKDAEATNKIMLYSMFTLSMGIAEHNATDEVETMIKKAEKALKLAQSRRNDIHLWDA